MLACLLRSIALRFNAFIMEPVTLYLLAGTFAASGVGSYAFVRMYLLSDFEVKSSKAGVLFSLTFGFCVCLLELFLLELSSFT